MRRMWSFDWQRWNEKMASHGKNGSQLCEIAAQVVLKHCGERVGWCKGWMFGRRRRQMFLRVQGVKWKRCAAKPSTMHSATVGLVIEKAMFLPRNAASFHQTNSGVGVGLHDGNITTNGDAAHIPRANKAWPMSISLCSRSCFHPVSIL